MSAIKRTIFGSIIGLAAVSAFAGAKCEPHPANEQIPQAKFEQQLKAQGYQIKRFKHDGNCYEIYGKNKEGKKVEIYFDTKTGKPVKSEIDD